MSLLRPYNPLVYPGGRRPGVDLSHPAAGPYGLSVISSGANLINLRKGAKKGSPTQGETYILDGNLGPTFAVGASSDVLSWTGYPAVIENNITMAMIFKFTGTQANGDTYLATGDDGVSGGWQLINSGTDFRFRMVTVSAITAGLPTPAANVPYAAIVSEAVNSILNFLLLNMITGQIWTTSQGAHASSVAGGGTWSAPGTVSQAKNIQYAAGMISPVYLSLPKMRAWAADIWSFWYPPTLQSLMFSGLGVAAGGGGGGSTAVGGNMSMMGVG